MKKTSRILSVALVALMVLSLTASAVAETPAVKIPNTLGKVKTADGVTVPTIDDIEDKIIWLTTSTDSAKMFDQFGNPIMSKYCKDRYTGQFVQAIGHTDDGDIYFHFSPKPDWAGVIWAEGFENLDVDENGDAVTSREGHLRQPGTWVANGPKSQGSWHVTGGDYAYMAGKTFEDGTSVSIQYGRSGSINYIEYTIPETDFFQTGMEGATATVKFVPVTVKSVCGPEEDPQKYTRYDYFYYVASVNVDYPAGNEIVRVETDWRNDTKQNLASYRISFATSETEVYKITFSPKSVSIYEDLTVSPKIYLPLTQIQGSLIPSTNFDDGTSIHTYYADDPIYGEYYKNGELKAVTGSGDNINKWYKPGHGKQVKGLKALKSFKSPRVR